MTVTILQSCISAEAFAADLVAYWEEELTPGPPLSQGLLWGWRRSCVLTVVPLGII